MKEVIEKAREMLLKEIDITGPGRLGLFEFANLKGQEIAERLGADKDIVMLGTILMDLKLGECMAEGKWEDHIKRSAIAAEQFLDGFDIEKESRNKIINCIESHHGGKYDCVEAEICANADCYKFLHPRAVFMYLKLLSGRFDDIDEVLARVSEKLEEKHKILSIDICKEELEEHYQMFRKLFEAAR